MEQRTSPTTVNKPARMVQFNQQETLLTSILAQTISISNQAVQVAQLQELDQRKCTLNQLPAYFNLMGYPCN